MESFIAANRPVVERLKQDYLDLLRSTAAPASAGMLAHAVFDQVAEALAVEQVPACTQGCACCCHVKVNLTPCEAFALARHIRTLPAPIQSAIAEQLAQASPLTRGLSSRERWALRRPCPLLSDEGVCQVYEARPLACRAHMSFDAGACRTEFESGQDVGVPTRQEFIQYRTLIWTALSLAERETTGRIAVLELIEALSRLLLAPDLESRWMAREDVLAEAADTGATARRHSFIDATGL